MSRFNTKQATTKVENLAGGLSYQQDPKLAFISILLTSFVKDQYYRKADETMAALGQYIDQIPDKRFVGKAAIYARTKFGMRSVSHVVAGELASKVKGEQWLKTFFNKIVYRPDDISEIMAYYKNLTGEKQTHAMRKGFAKALTRFDAYQIAKYRKDGADISLIDVANLVHPSGSEAVGQLIKGTLPAPKTWEQEISKAGRTEDDKKEELKKEAWAALIKERKLGYFALLRNLRNIIEQSPEVIEQACAMLADETLIRKSLVLPFRFMTASRQLQNDGINDQRVYKAINDALETSFANVPKFDGKTLVVVDHSGSMDSGDIGNMTLFEIGALFGVAMAKANYSDFMYFGDQAKYFGIKSIDSTTTIVEILKGLNTYNTPGTAVGHGTNFHAIFDEANMPYERVIIFSDMQGWVGYDTPKATFETYKRRTGANPKIYSIDLAGHGTMQFPEQDVFCLAGFSDKIFDLMKLLETDRSALITEIEKIEL